MKSFKGRFNDTIIIFPESSTVDDWNNFDYDVAATTSVLHLKKGSIFFM